MEKNQQKIDAGTIHPETVKQAAEQTADPAAVFADALLQLPTDPSALYQDHVLSALRAIRQKDEASFTRLVVKAKGHITKLSKLTAPDGNDRDGRIDNTTDVLISLAQGKCVLAHDADGRGIAVIDDGIIRQVWPLDSQGFNNWMRAAYFEATKTGVNEVMLSNAVSTLSAIANFKGEAVVVNLRCAKHGDAYYIDICDDEWRVIKVDTKGWEIVESSPILFIRTKNMRPLPIPQSPGDLGKLWNSINVTEPQRLLVIAWLIECYRPDTPYPILEWCGEQGSAKSTNQKRSRALVDPNKVSLRGRPKTVEDIYVSAANSYMVSFENLSHLTPEQQDSFCTLSTGGGFATRQFYTNGDEHVLETKRPVTLNGINQVATQPDMIERVVSIEAPTIPTDQRRDEQAIEALWAVDYPIVFAGLLDIFSAALAILPTVKLSSKQRMADFQLLGEAVAQAIGHPAGHFSEVYESTVNDGIGRSMETYGVANALQSFMAQQPDGVWNGTFLSLKANLELRNDADRSNWPKSARGLAGQIKRLTPGLRRVGIEIKYLGRDRNGSQLQITFSKHQ